MTDNNWLLTAIELLTQAHISKVHQERNGIACISVVDHQPLLLQLRNAVASSTGSKGASSDGSARIPFNPTALALFDEIVAQINTWYRVLPGAVEERAVDGRLRDWYVDYTNRLRAGKVSDVVDHDTTKLVEGWARRIESMFDPPSVIEMMELDPRGRPGHVGPPARCPEPDCRERWAFDRATGDRIAAVIVEYRNQGTETLEKATGVCRACGATWHGLTRLRELRWLLNADDPTTNQAESEIAS